MTDNRYLEAMTRLYNGDTQTTCQHPGCLTIILKSKTHCLKHSRHKTTDEKKFRRVRRGSR